MRVSDYDKFHYNYKEYWNNRTYEDKAEKIFLTKAFKKLSGNWFVDIGGSFGRHLPIYYEKYTHPVIVDYSFDTLKNNQATIKKSFPKTILIAANAYALPFKDSTFDGGLMVRVLHHIEDPKLYFKEIHRVLGKATYIQEFANKTHIKAILRALVTFKFSFFSEKPYQQPLKNFEGTNDTEAVFLNFHPNYIKKLMEQSGFRVEYRQNLSFLRIPILKRIFPLKLLLFKEAILQTLFGWLNVAPSIFYTAKTDKRNNKSENDITKILCCPKCRAELNIKAEKAICTQCKKEYQKKNDIWDFRV